MLIGWIGSQGRSPYRGRNLRLGILDLFFVLLPLVSMKNLF